MSEPVLVGLLFADRVIEEINRKKSIIGTFSQFYADRFPAQFPPWFIYAAVTNITGENSFALNLVFDKAQQVIFSISGKCQVENPRRVIELFFPVFRAIFLEEGVYTLTFNIDGNPVGSRILDVLKRPEQQPPNEPKQEGLS